MALDPLLKQKEWRFIDHSKVESYFNPLQSFAIDDTLCEQVGKKLSYPSIRTWVHHNTIVLGIQDTRLPFIQNGVEFLKANGYRVIVRNSGGLAVVLDEGILNISIIIPEENGININRGYDAMFNLIQHMLASHQTPIVAKEITGSYCPGSYDLSIFNKKFAGISQRRLRGGIAVQIYLCAAGSGSNRATLLKEFYERSIQQEIPPFTIPIIRSETMASLSELLKADITAQSLQEVMLETIQNESPIVSSMLSDTEVDLFHYHLERIIKRNKKTNIV